MTFPELNASTRPLVLLVEDYEPNILVASVYLESNGYDYDVARSGEEALEKYLQKPYVAILMDVQMPHMSGLDVTRSIRLAEHETGAPKIMIIGMTAYAMKGDREVCLNAGMDDYISKPVSQEMLIGKLNALIHRA